ncbi:MAG: DUF1566 domain-containing protein [Deltaproteobacteria bacterium]|nr:DUF1566 domain-containing protein [Deltaproteobacteria bacterium]
MSSFSLHPATVVKTVLIACGMFVACSAPGVDQPGENGDAAIDVATGVAGTGGGVATGSGGRGSGGRGGNSLATGGRASGGSLAGSGGAPSATGGNSGVPGTSGCTPAIGIPYSYACWPMPNPATTGLPLPNPASYADMGDGTVKDNVTGLIWQKAVTSTQAFTWDGAKAYCTNLTLAGRTWRLPTRIELLSIVDFTRTSPALNVAAFPNTPGGKFHWTSSPWVVSQIATKPQYSWIVNFYEGLTSNAGDRTQTQYARCVSAPPAGAGPLPTLYTQIAAGEIKDNLTGLIWQQASTTATMPFAGAAGICAGLTLNGQTWRLPSIKELSTLVNETPPITKVSPAIDTATFPDTPSNGAYWSSSLFNSQPASAHLPWVINFTDGFTQSSLSAARVKCVR